jgi:hypothetical protein
VAILSYGVAQIGQVLGLIGPPAADALIYAASLGIAPPFLMAMVALHETIVPERRMWSGAALLFAAIYVTYVALTYAVQLSAVLPTTMSAPAQEVLGVRPQSLFWVVDGLGYISMGIATLLAGLAVTAAAPGLWARRLLLANGLVTPLIAVVYFYPRFSVGLLMLGSPWLVTAGGSMLALAVYFRSLRSR